MDAKNGYNLITNLIEHGYNKEKHGDWQPYFIHMVAKMLEDHYLLNK